MSAIWRIEWTDAEDSQTDAYNVYLENDPPGQKTLHASAVRFGSDVEVPETDSPVVVWLAPIIGGVEVEEDFWIPNQIIPTSLADIPLPPDVENFVVAQDEGKLVARWDAVRDEHFSHCEIRTGPVSPDWDAGVRVAASEALQATVSWAWWATGEQTFYIKAVSKQGQYSSGVVTFTVTVTDLGEFVQEGSDLTQEPSWSGTKVGAEVVSNELRPTSLPTDYTTWTSPADYNDLTDDNLLWWWSFYKNPTYTTAAIDAGAIVNEVLHMNAGVDVQEVVSDYTEWLGPQFKGEVDDESDTEVYRSPFATTEFSYVYYAGTELALVNGVELKIQVQLAQDGVPTWGAVQTWVPGATYTFRQARFVVTLITRVPLLFAKLTGLTFRRFRRNWKDEGSISVADVGDVITFTRPFTKAPSLGYRVVDDANYRVVFSNITKSGCDVDVKDNADDSAVAADIEWSALGV